MRDSRRPARLSVALTFALLGAATLSGCIPTANNAPDGAAALPCLGPACVPYMTGGAPVTTAPTVNCAEAEQGIEFAPFTVMDNENGTAQYLYEYVDGTAGLFPNGYSPPAILQDVCSDQPTGNQVLHMSGGPFFGWGGGIGIGLAHLNQDAGLCANPAVVCPQGGGSTTSTSCYCPALGTGATGQAIFTAALDVSQYDGISFWARRGPNGQPLLRVLVGDKYTDDDISYLTYVGDPTEPRFCERKGECGCLFQGQSAQSPDGGLSSVAVSCTFYSDDPAVDPNYSSDVVAGGGYYCGCPGCLPGAASQAGTSSTGTTSNMCNTTLCNAPYPAYPTNGPDPQFSGHDCSPYTYRNGTELDLCYTPGKDPPPPEPDAQCGDHFTFPVNLSTDWKFYTVPFNEMFQQGWAKQAPRFDLTSVSVVRFTWDVGYIDYYIDNLRFYRVAH